MHRRIAGLLVLATLAAAAWWRAVPPAREDRPSCLRATGVRWPGGRALVCLGTRRVLLSELIARLGLPRGLAFGRHLWVETGRQVRFDPHREPVIGPLPAQDLLVLGCRLHLNTTSRTDLELLPGIGAKLAERIVDYRERHGRFSAVERLEAVRGIGPRTVARLAPFLRVGPGGSAPRVGFPCPGE